MNTVLVILSLLGLFVVIGLVWLTICALTAKPGHEHESEPERVEAISAGRRRDVLIEDSQIYDPDTGQMRNVPFEFVCWADHGLTNLLWSVPGVSRVYEYEKGKYTVCVDHRFDIEFVKNDVVAAVLCGRVV